MTLVMLQVCFQQFLPKGKECRFQVTHSWKKQCFSGLRVHCDEDIPLHGSLIHEKAENFP